MLIAAAAQQAGVNVQTIRYYERRGLLPRPARRASSTYRQYSLDTIRIVRFIKRAQDLGFTLDEIDELLELRGEPRRDRSRVRALAERKLRQVGSKIAELQAMQHALAHLVRCCAAGTTLECPIIDALDQPEQAP
jgi:Hg(II)-responsive transcriptional regulator